MATGRPNRCPRCDGSMTEGVIIDNSYGEKKVSAWAEGRPEKRWYGLKFPKKVREITSFRCNRCGYLESYAR